MRHSYSMVPQITCNSVQFTGLLQWWYPCHVPLCQATFRCSDALESGTRSLVFLRICHRLVKDHSSYMTSKIGTNGDPKRGSHCTWTCITQEVIFTEETRSVSYSCIFSLKIELGNQIGLLIIIKNSNGSFIYSHHHRTAHFPFEISLSVSSWGYHQPKVWSETWHNVMSRVQ